MTLALVIATPEEDDAGLASASASASALRGGGKVRRIARHLLALAPASSGSGLGLGSRKRVLTLGGVSVSIPALADFSPQVPAKYLPDSLDAISQLTLSHFLFLLKKQSLGQDVFLIGAPGPQRRRLIHQFAELTGRGIQYIAIHPDSSESDLKQRREIINNGDVVLCPLRRYKLR